MQNNTTLPRWGKRLAGATLLVVAVTAGTLGLMLNVSHGLEAGLAAGIAFGLADLAKILIPVVAGIIGWSRQMKVTAAICVAVSLWSAVNVYLDGAGAALLAKQHGAVTYGDVGKRIAELEAETASFRTLANNEAKSGGCGKSCRALLDKADQAAARLDKARAKRTDMKPVEISGLAAMIAIASGASSDGIARGIGAFKALLFLALLEALVWLTVPAMALLASATLARTEPETSQILAEIVVDAEPVAVIEPPTPVTPETVKLRPGTANYYMARLQRDHPAIAQRVAAGEISVYAASVEAGLRKAPKASAKWTKPDAYLPPATVTA